METYHSNTITIGLVEIDNMLKFDFICRHKYFSPESAKYNDIKITDEWKKFNITVKNLVRYKKLFTFMCLVYDSGWFCTQCLPFSSLFKEKHYRICNRQIFMCFKFFTFSRICMFKHAQFQRFILLCNIMRYCNKKSFIVLFGL